MEEGNQDVLLAKPTKDKDEIYLKSLPTGYRFKPRDDELVDYYLRRKVNNKSLPPNRIKEVQLYKYDPETLTVSSKNKSSNGVVNEWYFFTPRERKYRNGKRPDRGAGDGFWKATGADKHVKRNGKLVGLKKTLVYYKGKPPHGDKTNWIMHEYVLSDPPAIQRAADNDMQLDKWVLCRVYNKQKNAGLKPETPQQSTDQEEEEAEDSIFPAQIETQNQEHGIPPPQTETQNQEHGIPPPQTETQNQEHGIPPPQTETQILEYWIPPDPQPVQQFQVQNFNMLLPQSQQACPMPFYNHAYHNSTFGRSPQFPGHDSTIFSQQTVSGYGNFRPTVPPVSFIPPPPHNQFHFMGNNNFNIHHDQQQQQFSGAIHNYDFSVDDKFLLNADFSLPKN